MEKDTPRRAGHTAALRLHLISVLATWCGKERGTAVGVAEDPTIGSLGCRFEWQGRDCALEKVNQTGRELCGLGRYLVYTWYRFCRHGEARGGSVVRVA